MSRNTYRVRIQTDLAALKRGEHPDLPTVDDTMERIFERQKQERGEERTR